MNKKTREKLLKVVRDNYEEIGEDFSNTRNYVWPELKKIINAAIARSEATKQSRWNSNIAESTGLPRRSSRLRRDSLLAMTTLDIGCGNGRIMELFNNNVNYTGVEQSKKLAHIAKERCKKRGGECKIIEGDILELDKYVKGKFDLILYIAVLHHIPSHELRVHFLKQLKGKLKNDGQLIITVWNLSEQLKYKKMVWKHNLLKLVGLNKMDFNDILFPGFNKKSLRYYHVFSESELRKLLKDTGWKIEKLYSDKRNIYAICAA